MPSIQISRILSKLDEYLGRADYDGAERHLKYWLAEAQSLSDKRGEFAVANEMIGFYRKQDRKEDCYSSCDTVLKQIKELNLEDSIGGATAYLNIGTARKNFGEPEEAICLYEKAKSLYEKYLDSTDMRMAGLYNNLALALSAVERYDEAEKLFNNAIELNEKGGYDPLDRAISYVNLAELEEAKSGLEDGIDKISAYLEKAETEFDLAEKGGYYAFVAEKCYPSFEYFGFFFTAERLKSEAEEIRRKLNEGA